MPANFPKLTTRQKTAFGGLSVALVALGANYLFFSGEPKSAGAAEVSTPESTVANSPTVVDSTKPAAAAVGENLISKSLEQLSSGIPESTPLRDVFKIPSGWLPDPAVEIAQSARIDPAAAKVFADAHHLKMIFRSSTAAEAIVNGRLMKVGDRLDGFRLEAVFPNSVRFVSPNGSVDLSLPGTDSGSDNAN